MTRLQALHPRLLGSDFVDGDGVRLAQAECGPDARLHLRHQGVRSSAWLRRSRHH
jgi:hypothetical protein